MVSVPSLPVLAVCRGVGVVVGSVEAVIDVIVYVLVIVVRVDCSSL